MITDKADTPIEVGDKVYYAKDSKLFEGTITRIRVEIDFETMKSNKDIVKKESQTNDRKSNR